MEEGKMRKITVMSLVALLLLTLPINLIAQEASGIVSGTRVRVNLLYESTKNLPENVVIKLFAAKGKMIGNVLALKPDTLVLKFEDLDAPLPIPSASITKLEVSQGGAWSGPGALKGAGIGLAIGTPIGVVADNATDFGEDEFFIWAGASAGAIYGSIIGGGGKNALKGIGIGLVSGAAAGLVLHRVVFRRYGDIEKEARLIVLSVGAGVGGIVGGIVGGGERWKEVSLQKVNFGISPYSTQGLVLSASFSF